MEVNRGNGTSEMFFNKLHKDVVIKFVCRQVICMGHPINIEITTHVNHYSTLGYPNSKDVGDYKILF